MNNFNGPKLESITPDIEKKESREKFAEGLYASWEVMSACNLSCAHCYALNEESDHDFKKIDLSRLSALGSQKRLSIEDIEKGLNNLEKVGTRFFNIEGGEPTLRKDVERIVEMAKERGMKTVLSTHGMYLLEEKNGQPHLAERLRGKLDTMALSLDADNAEVNDSIRVKPSGKPSDHFDKVVDFFKWYGEEFSKMTDSSPPLYSLKINTTVTQLNIDSIENIRSIISEHIPKEAVVNWKIIQVHPRGKGREAKEELGITDDEFGDLIEKIKSEETEGVSVESRSYSEDTYPFLVIGFSGDSVVPKGESQEPIEHNGKAINVLDSNFYDGLHDYIDKNPDFIPKNKEINSYTKKD